MNTYSKLSKCAGSIFLASACLASSAATAGIRNLPLTVNFPETSEKFAPYDAVRCANVEAIAVGMTSGTGTMVISANNGRKSIKIPVVLSASDCPSESMYFHNGKFTLMTPNGQTLTATYEGQFFPPDPKNLSFLKMNTGAFAITGGTGYFSGASGSGQLQGTVSITSLPTEPFAATGSLNGTGTISFSKQDFEQHFNVSQ